MITVQKLKITTSGAKERAEKYFSILGKLNDIRLSKREIDLLTFMAVRGSISVGGNKKLFANEHNCSVFSVNNTISLLKKKGLIEKTGKRWGLPKLIALDFSKDLILQITLDEINKGEDSK